jgi:hypothetical protein
MSNGSVASNVSESRRKRKRKRTGESSRDVSDADDSDTDTSPNNLRSRLAKRIHTAKSRKSQLSKTVILSNKSSADASPNGSSHGPTPTSANGSAMDKDSSSSEGDGDAEDSDLDDWANEFDVGVVALDKCNERSIVVSMH